MKSWKRKQDLRIEMITTGRKKRNFLVFLSCFFLQSILIAAFFFLQNNIKIESVSVSTDQYLSSHDAVTTVTSLADGWNKTVTTEDTSQGTKVMTLTDKTNANGSYSYRMVITNKLGTNDDREVIRIVEILPHYISSYLAFMIDGYEPVTQLSLDKMATLADNSSGGGYDGNVQLTFGNLSSEYKMFTVLKNYITTQTLDEYSSNTIGNKVSYSGVTPVFKWQQYSDGGTTTDSGYFKYVGAGLGLYSLYVGNASPTYEIQEIAGVGDYEIKDFRYYVYDPGNNLTDSNLNTEADYNIPFRILTSADGNYSFDSDGRLFGWTYQYRPEILSTYPDGSGGDYYYVEVGGADQGYFVYNPLTSGGTREDTSKSGLVYYDIKMVYDNIPTSHIGKGNTGFSYAYVPIVDKIKITPGSGQYRAKSLSGQFVAINTANNTADPYNTGFTAQYDVDALTVKSYTATADKTQASYIWVSQSNAQVSIPLSARYGYGYLTGKDIFVGNYTRVNSVYAKDSYKNNEWFKLICLGAGGYDSEKSALDNYKSKENEIEDILAEFDQKYRFEVILCSPDQLLDSDLDGARLVNVGDNSIFSTGDVSNYLISYLSGWEGFTHGMDVRFKNDIPDFDQVLSIYRKATSSQMSLIYSVHGREYEIGTVSGFSDGYGGASSNLAKLFMFFNVFTDPQDMELFLPDSQVYQSNPYKNQIATIMLTDGAEDLNQDGIYETSWKKGDLKIYFKNGIYQVNYVMPDIVDGVDDFSNITHKYTSIWNPAALTNHNGVSGERMYFLLYPYYLINGGTSFAIYLHNYNMIADLNYSIYTLANVGKAYVLPDGTETTYMMGTWDMRAFINNINNLSQIHQILTGFEVNQISVSITNGITGANGDKYLYLDEFQSSYDINIKTSATQENPITSIQIGFDDDSNGTLDTIVYSGDGTDLDSDPLNPNEVIDTNAAGETDLAEITENKYYVLDLRQYGGGQYFSNTSSRELIVQVQGQFGNVATDSLTCIIRSLYDLN